MVGLSRAACAFGAAVLAAALALPAGALARDWTSPRPGDAATRAFERPATPPDAATLKAQASAAALVQKAREDEWDRKTRRATRSICTGAKGC
ncbi:MAG TPA: hypothetical protein VF744_12460 [Beijerinckiaceae bacterium]